MAKAAIRLPIGGQKRRKLLVLLAAFADAGNSSPSFAQLGPRLPFLEWGRAGRQRWLDVRKLHDLQAALVREGWLEIVVEGRPGQPTVYRLLLDREGPPK